MTGEGSTGRERARYIWKDRHGEKEGLKKEEGEMKEEETLCKLVSEGREGTL